LSAGSIPAIGITSVAELVDAPCLEHGFLEVGVRVPSEVVFMQKINQKVKIIWPKNYLFNSFWAPKVINRFIIKGNKEYVEKEFSIFFSSLKKITINPVFLLLGLIKKVRPIFGLKKILNKVSKLKSDDDNEKPIPKYIRIPMIMRKLRGLKIGIKWFKDSCLLFWSRVRLHTRLYNETVSLFVYKNSKILNRKKTLYEEGLKNRLSVKYRWRNRIA
jgi:hypothetical protein